MRLDLQCWATRPEGQRCDGPSVRGGFFCIEHSRNGLPAPETIWREPEDQMPPRLVAFIRANVPGALFPSPPAPEESAAPPAVSRHAETDPAASPATAGEPAPPEKLNRSPGPSSDEWLLTLLRESMEELAASRTPPLQKAGAMARLGSLYLRAARADELRQANQKLKKRIATLVERLEAATLVTADASAAPPPAASTAPPPAKPMPLLEPPAFALPAFRDDLAPHPTALEPPGSPDADLVVAATDSAGRAPP